MKELGMVVMGCLIFLGFFSTVIYPDLEYKGYSSVQNCSGECYEEYVRIHGSVVDQLKEKAEPTFCLIASKSTVALPEPTVTLVFK